MTEHQAAPSDKLDPYLLKAAFAIILGGIAVIFDTTIVTIALHQLGKELGASVSTIQWISTGYLLAMFVAIPATGWLQARFGGKVVWLASLVAFGAGSLLCAFAWDAPSLIVFRVVQGLGGGVMMPLMVTLLLQAAKGQPLGKVMAVVGLPISLGPILGPVLGGLILGVGSWHWLFLVNIPFCIGGFIASARILRKDRPETPHTAGFDWVGFAMCAPGIVGVIYALSNVSKDGGVGRTDVWLPMVLGVALVVGFIVWALRRKQAALIDLELMRHRPLAVGSALMFLMGFVLFGSMFLLPLFFQELRGESALGAGLLLIPQGVGSLLSRSIGGRLTDTVGPRLVAALGFGIALVGTIPFAFADADTSMVWLLAVLLVRGMGLGMVMTPIMAVAYNGLEKHEMPDASILTRVFQQVGGSFGTAVLATVLAGATSGARSLDGLADGFDEVFWWAVAFSAIGVAVAFILPKRPVTEAAVNEPAAV